MSGQGRRPAGFDPAAYPILARHWFGVEPRRSADMIEADVIADLRRQRHVRKLHRLGPRVLDELLVEIGAERSITTIIERKIERYAALDPTALEALRGDRFSPLPIHGVPNSPPAPGLKTNACVRDPTVFSRGGVG